ncbi:uncharacterized protein LOC108905320 [Anoplophora glabripennis]|uniref:uncharacterized protein LOC108905320 n=1 Tax=Anoplophora glabripennis TaxID=217634 RepID=UPI00087521F0|nr:uncharacterized protein LOC108905320 [Anoplophora glabripennis]
MTLTVLLPFLLCLIVSQAQFNNSEKIVLRRIARNAVSGFGQYVTILDKIIIDNCKANGQYEAAEKLQYTFDETQSCLSKKKAIVTPREEYLALIDECRRESGRQSKSCLAESQRYFPDILLEYHKSIINFLYEDDDIIRENMVDCFPKLENRRVQADYFQCLKNSAIRTGDSRRIPDTKERFCQNVLDTPYCFTNIIKENCDKTPGVEKFIEDFITANRNVCEASKAVQCATFKPHLVVILIYLIKLLY